MPIGFILRILGPVLAALAVFAWGYSMGGASKQRDWDVEKARMIQSAFEMSERARLKEQADRERLAKAEQNGQTEKAKAERDAALLRADADRVRSEFAAYIRGPAQDTLAACVARGEATGVVLEQAIRTSGEMAVAGEQCEADKRTLMGAWPN
jgi:hypothetical protein